MVRPLHDPSARPASQATRRDPSPPFSQVFTVSPLDLATGAATVSPDTKALTIRWPGETVFYLLPGASASRFLAALQNLPSGLVALSIENCLLTPHHLAALELPRGLNRLELRNAGVTEVGARILFERLRAIEGLESLELADNELGEALMAQAIPPNLRHLGLYQAIGIGRPSVEAPFIRSLAEHPQLRSLTLDGNGFTADFLSNGLTLPRGLEHLGMARTSQDEGALKRFVKRLAERNPALRSLDLRDNVLQDLGDLEIPRALRSLNLSENSISTLTATFTSALARHSCLEALDLSGNPLRSLEGLELPPSLARLDLRATALGPSCVDDLRRAVAQRPRLETLLLAPRFVWPSGVPTLEALRAPPEERRDLEGIRASELHARWCRQFTRGLR